MTRPIFPANPRDRALHRLGIMVADIIDDAAGTECEAAHLREDVARLTAELDAARTEVAGANAATQHNARLWNEERTRAERAEQALAEERAKHEATRTDLATITADATRGWQLAEERFAEIERARLIIDGAKVAIAEMEPAVAERDTLRARVADLEAVADQVTTVADESFGPFPVQSAADSLTAIERGIFADRQREEAWRKATGVDAPEKVRVLRWPQLAKAIEKVIGGPYGSDEVTRAVFAALTVRGPVLAPQAVGGEVPAAFAAVRPSGNIAHITIARDGVEAFARGGPGRAERPEDACVVVPLYLAASRVPPPAAPSDEEIARAFHDHLLPAANSLVGMPWESRTDGMRAAWTAAVAKVIRPLIALAAPTCPAVAWKPAQVGPWETATMGRLTLLAMGTTATGSGGGFIVKDENRHIIRDKVMVGADLATAKDAAVAFALSLNGAAFAPAPVVATGSGERVVLEMETLAGDAFDAGRTTAITDDAGIRNAKDALAAEAIARLRRATMATAAVAPAKAAGVYLIKSTHGYSVQVDGVSLKMDASWSNADDIARRIATNRPRTDAMGYGRPGTEGGSRSVHDAPAPVAPPVVEGFALPAIEWDTADDGAAAEFIHEPHSAAPGIGAHAHDCGGWDIYMSGSATDLDAAKATVERAHRLLTGAAVAKGAPERDRLTAAVVEAARPEPGRGDVERLAEAIEASGDGDLTAAEAKRWATAILRHLAGPLPTPDRAAEVVAAFYDEIDKAMASGGKVDGGDVPAMRRALATLAPTPTVRVGEIVEACMAAFKRLSERTYAEEIASVLTARALGKVVTP